MMVLMCLILMSSNRTIVGLKAGTRQLQHGQESSSNRTIVGLKVGTAIVARTMFMAAIAPLWD